MKPRIPGYEFSTVINEAFCLKLANLVGLKVAGCSINEVGEHEFLLVERYDRIFKNPNTLHRLHQEDFCQALGIPPERKYQNDGGPSLAQCFKLLRKASDEIILDIPMLLDAVIFNYIIGNCDAHGKNFSLLYYAAKIGLAPLYDLLSTLLYPELSSKMAMKIGGVYPINKVNKDSFMKLAQDAELNKSITLNRVAELAGIIRQNLDKTGVQDQHLEKLQTLIEKRSIAVAQIFG